MADWDQDAVDEAVRISGEKIDALRLRIEQLENAQPLPPGDEPPSSILIQLADGTLLTYVKEGA